MCGRGGGGGGCGGQGECQSRRNEGRRKLQVGTTPGGRAERRPGRARYVRALHPRDRGARTDRGHPAKRSKGPEPPYGSARQFASLGAARQCESGAVPAWSPSWSASVASMAVRSEERRVGKECVGTGRSRW